MTKCFFFFFCKQCEYLARRSVWHCSLCSCICGWHVASQVGLSRLKATSRARSKDASCSSMATGMNHSALVASSHGIMPFF
jgi:hypothetical protein